MSDVAMWLCRTCQKPCSTESPFCNAACKSAGGGEHVTDPHAHLIELEERVTRRWQEAVAARTQARPVPDMDWSTDWAEAMQKPLPPGTMQFPREQWVSYPNRRTHVLILADRLLDFEELTDEQWHTLCFLMLYGGKERIA